ncbi:MAG: hypothetical protein PHO80_06065 [Candidatus Gracilibacteria bacterium]|nr:hypothetical protein [Candidatus Gracilibacteria bacterium]MDD4531083.1 hypothetical protein [Candidatus Gracilibacteria bacterium]
MKNSDLVAYCGLFCGECRAYKAGKCPSCAKNEKATWCKVKSCCENNKYKSCADCKTYSDPEECKFFNNFFSKLFKFLFKSNRKGCICKIKEVGPEKYAEFMTEKKCYNNPDK